MKSVHAIPRVVIATGISSIVTQLLVIREILAQFSGNEFVIALIFFNWLILGGIGTGLSHLVTRFHKKAGIYLLAWLSFLLASLPPIQIAAIRILRDSLFIHGASVGFYPTLAFTFFSIAPYCLLVGFVLPYSLFALRSESPDYPGARIYILDNIGDVSGGALFSFVLVFLVSPLQTVFFSNLPLLISTWLLFPAQRRYSLIVLFCALLTLSTLIAGIYFETKSLEPREGKLVYYHDSRYNRITVHQDMEQYTLFTDGTPVFSNQNLVMAEETVHYSLSQLENVRDILLISAQGGMMSEVEKYSPETVDYVELDPAITNVQFEFGLLKRISGLNVINKDGRAYLTETDRMYDAVIVNLPEPETFQINRFYTDRFFGLVKEHLAPHGIYSFSMQGFDNYLAEPQRRKLSSLYNTVKKHFANVLLLPGQNVFFLCSDQPLTTDIPHILDRKNIETNYISYYFEGNITGERIKYLNELMDPTVPENLDNSPRLMKLMFSQWFTKFSTSPTGFMIVLAVLSLIYLARISREEFVLFSTGCMTMGCEILVIFTFQIFFGYIYLQIGIIVTIFLAGLLPGAWFGARLRHTGAKTLALTDVFLIIMMGLLILGLLKGGDRLPVASFLIFGFLVSMACGFQFPVALNLKGDDNHAITRTFSADLVGAAYGTLITSIVLIPYLGIVWAAAGLICLKLISLGVIGFTYEKNQ